MSLLSRVLQDFWYLFVALFSHEMKLTIGVGIHRIIEDAASTLILNRPIVVKNQKCQSHLVLYEFKEDPSAPFPTEFFGEPSLLLAPTAPAVSGSRGLSASPSSSPILSRPPPHPLHHVTVGHLVVRLACKKKEENI
jgi:hypothetical protein